MTTAPPLSLTVSVINYRTAELTIACIRSVLDDLAATPGLSGHVVVVDNASGDGSAEAIAAFLDSLPAPAPVSLVRSDRNTGFSGGHNQGMAARPAEAYLILNSDALLRPGFLAALLAGMAEDPGAGLYAPRLEGADGVQQISCFRFPSPWSELIRGAASGPVTRLLARHDVPRELPHAPGQDGWASFACILLRDAVLRAVGPMDEGYFLYFEDAEYAWRARKAGFRLRHVPAARVVHHRGGSGPVKSLAQARKRLPGYYYASRTRFFRQAYGPAGPLLANLMWHLGRGIAGLRLLAGKPLPARTEGEARDLWTNILAPLGDRFGGAHHDDA